MRAELLRQPGGFESFATQSERVKRTFLGQVITFSSDIAHAVCLAGYCFSCKADSQGPLASSTVRSSRLRSAVISAPPRGPGRLRPLGANLGKQVGQRADQGRERLAGLLRGDDILRG